MAEERIQKIMAEQGLCSRRAAEQIIAEGRVKVNGHPVKVGDKMDPNRDVLHVDDERIYIQKNQQLYYLALYKPRGYVTKPKAEKPPRQKAKITLDAICTMLRGVGTLLRAVFGAIRFTKISVCLGVRGEDPAAAARNYGKLQAWLYPTLGVLDHFFFLEFDQLRVLPDFGSAQPTVQDRVSFRVSAQALFIVIAAVRVLYEFWRKKVLDIFI